MNDPHVNALIYKVIAANDVDYDKAMPFSEECADFTLSIDSQKAAFRMKGHFATEEEARKLVDNFLQKWSIFSSIGLEYSPDEIKFDFKSAEIIDRNPPKKPCNSESLNVCVSSSIHVSEHLSRSKFPSLPQNFAVSTDVETMYLRYKAYRENREPLTSMANMCLTVLEVSAGSKQSRKKAAQKYFIHFDVLKKLGELVSERGSKLEARKMPKSGTLIPLTQKEKSWIEEVIKKIIFRVGERAFDQQKQLPQITMNDFIGLDKN